MQSSAEQRIMVSIAQAEDAIFRKSMERLFESRRAQIQSADAGVSRRVGQSWVVSPLSWVFVEWRIEQDEQWSQTYDVIGYYQANHRQDWTESAVRIAEG